jgi:IS30 family transposase
MVASKLVLDWSPEQISGWLKTQYPDGESMRVSHEAIYRSLFLQARGVLKQELMEHLRRMRRSLHATVSGQSAARSSMPSRSAKGPQKRKTERFLGIGTVICSAAHRTVTSRL